MDITDKIKLRMMESEVQDIEAWIRIAEGTSIWDKIARIQFSIRFKTAKHYANFLRLLKRQKKEEIKLFKKHLKERDNFKGNKYDVKQIT